MLSTFLPLLALAASINAAPFHKSGAHHKRQNGVVYNCNGNGFAYTWDDGPYIYHNEILDHFDGVGKKTTFFMNGDNWSCIYDDDNVQAIRRTYEEGHQVASHTWSHADLTTLTHAQIDVELLRLDQAFINILGVKPRFLRPPYGSINDEVANYIQTVHGKTIVMWSDDSTDSVGGSVQDSVNFYNTWANQNPKQPHICLSHETEPSGIGALEQNTVENLNSHGVNLQTVAACIDEDPYEVVTGVYGNPDSTWYCGGSWTPPPTSSTSTSGSGSCVQTYTSQAGDTCTSIGQKFGLTANQILTANSFLNCNDIWTNTPICIPRGGSTSTSTRPTSTSTSTSTSRTTTSTTPPSCVSTYTSVAGDTCASIEQKFGLAAGQILAANSFLNCNDIWTYTPICIPPGGTGPTSTTTTRTSTSTSTRTSTSTSSSTSAAPSCVSTYTSAAGDTCASIGQKYGLTGDQILQANTFLNCNDIWTYTPICIPPGGSGACTRTVTVPNETTCSAVASQYGITAAQVQTWNSFVNCNDIWAGTSLCVAHS